MLCYVYVMKMSWNRNHLWCLMLRRFIGRAKLTNMNSSRHHHYWSISQTWAKLRSFMFNFCEKSMSKNDDVSRLCRFGHQRSHRNSQYQPILYLHVAVADIFFWQQATPIFSLICMHCPSCRPGRIYITWISHQWFLMPILILRLRIK